MLDLIDLIIIIEVFLVVILEVFLMNFNRGKICY